MAPIMNFDRDDQLFKAISSDNLRSVKRLIGSGIGLNSVLHNPDRLDSTTILSEAAFAGSIDIVKYLVKAGALIDHKDPCFRRTALHYACIGRQTETATFLIKNKADVNCVDRDNVTPIIYAVIGGCHEIVESLIENGANPHIVDRLRSSALHYAAFHSNSAVVSRLIQVGCIPNNRVIFGQGTPMASLMYNKDYVNCRLLLESGYDLSNEENLQEFKDTFDKSLENVNDSSSSSSQMNYIVRWLKTPQSLQCFCRTVIRNSMRGSRLQQRIGTLPIPSQIKRYLLFI